jgi:hypothetical protein
MIGDLKELKGGHYAILVAAFLMAVSPGFLMLYLFNPVLLASWDSVKVILFSIALSLPVFCANVIAAILTLTMCNVPTKDMRVYPLVMAVVQTFVSTYSSLLIAYFFELGFKPFVATLAITTMLGFPVLQRIAKQKASQVQ